MNQDIDENLTRQVARLARLKLTDSEVKLFAPQLSKIIHFMEKLQEVDIQGVEPLIHPLPLNTPLRADEVRPFPQDRHGNPKVLSSAPDILDNGFRVPPVL